MKKCPYCAEEIQDEAKFCRFCNNWLSPNTDVSPVIVGKENKKNSQKKKLLIVALITYSLVLFLIMVQFLNGFFIDPYGIILINLAGLVLVVILFYFLFRNMFDIHWVLNILISSFSSYILNFCIGFLAGMIVGTSYIYGDNFDEFFYEKTQSPAFQNTNAPLPVTSAKPTPTKKPTVYYKSPTPAGFIEANCRHWSEMENLPRDVTYCVYGTAIDTFHKDGVFYIVFGNSPTDFYFISYGEYWFEGMKGNCVMATGELKEIGSAPVIVVDGENYFHCEE